ncbi:hypothetical protein E9993_14640 [Labilibacter sediminis]|nr:hypothetical protein E9993_14640 [Labilibacter sediminis]
MRDQLFKFLLLTKIEVLAPVGGGGVGIFAWAVKLAPFISVTAAVIGVVLGIMSFRLKRKQAKLEMALTKAQLNQFKNK